MFAFNNINENGHKFKREQGRVFGGRKGNEDIIWLYYNLKKIKDDN